MRSTRASPSRSTRSRSTRRRWASPGRTASSLARSASIWR
jgi:hypothetical protein